ncbi:MAG: CDGSH iron-sulfur domain-containing protein [Merismopedia sp. SIO2A8]|nr:CDGSH iron-sulfur domain-containing protein [Symploca sp. SIO2B6]NET48149.1 CDGSH iron-sulfur domain-containing protein [Merismopedia sp. SIO2A8]
MADVTLSVLDNGPVIVKGDFTVADGAGNAYPSQKQVALCRCGASVNKPFCDGAHAKAGFEAAERAPAE